MDTNERTEKLSSLSEKDLNQVSKLVDELTEKDGFLLYGFDNDWTLRVRTKNKPGEVEVEMIQAGVVKWGGTLTLKALRAPGTWKPGDKTELPPGHESMTDEEFEAAFTTFNGIERPEPGKRADPRSYRIQMLEAHAPKSYEPGGNKP